MNDEPWGEGEDETVYAQGRVPERTYASKSFLVNRENSQDFGHPARFVHKVFDSDQETIVEYDGTEWIITETEKGRYQFKLLVAKEAGRVKELWIQRVPPGNSIGKVKLCLNLRSENVVRLIELLKNLDYLPVDGEATVRVDDALLRDVLASPDSVTAVYRRDPEAFRQVISSDESARDVIALSRRRNQVQRFRNLLENDDYFDREAGRLTGGRPEALWQQFFQENSWIFGLTLAGQLLTAWDGKKLEQNCCGIIDRRSWKTRRRSLEDRWRRPIYCLCGVQASSHPSARKTISPWMLDAIRGTLGRRCPGTRLRSPSCHRTWRPNPGHRRGW